MNTESITITLATGQSATYTITREHDASLIGNETLRYTVKAMAEGLQAALDAKPQIQP